MYDAGLKFPSCEGIMEAALFVHKKIMTTFKL